MAKIDDGGPASPAVIQWRWGEEIHCPGLSLRDYFAAHALSGWLASFGDDQPHPARCRVADMDAGNENVWQVRVAMQARDAYRLADAMIHESKKGQ